MEEETSPHPLAPSPTERGGTCYIPGTLKLDRVYDYFVEAAGMGFGSRPNLQRWVEIQNLIADARHLDEDYRRVLKTIGLFNLVTTTGAVKATPELVTLALCDSPNDEEQQQK